MRVPGFILRPIANRLIEAARDGKFDRRDVGDGRGNVFFWRYRVFKSKWLSVFLHEFIRGDGERCLHDHPWSFVTIILRGGYWETVAKPEVDCFDSESFIYWREPGRVLYRPAEFSHRIDIEPPGGFNDDEPWSLVFVGPKVRDWGFYTLNGWKRWITGQPNPICATDAFENARIAAHSQGFDVQDYGPEPVGWRDPVPAETGEFVTVKEVRGDLTADEIEERKSRYRFDSRHDRQGNY